MSLQVPVSISARTKSLAVSPTSALCLLLLLFCHFVLTMHISIGGHRRSALLGSTCSCMLDAARVWWQRAIVHRGRSVFLVVTYLLTCICYFAWSRGLNFCIRLGHILCSLTAHCFSTVYISCIVIYFRLDVVDLSAPANFERHKAHPKAGLLAQFFLEIHGLLGGRQRSGLLGPPCLVLPSRVWQFLVGGQVRITTF